MGTRGRLLLAVAVMPLTSTASLAQDDGTIERIEIAVGDLVFDARAAGPHDGPLVLLLHGFPQTSYAFRHQLRVLGGLGYRAVAPDQRGYSPGARPTRVADYAMARLSEDVAGIATALRAERFHLVGHDWGGAVAWVVASRYPNRVRTLTVLSTPHFVALSSTRSTPGSDQARRSSYLADFAAPGAEASMLENGAARLRSIYGDLPVDAVEEYLGALGAPAALRAALAWYGAAFGPGTGGGTSAAPARPPTPVSVPTTYVWSTADPAFGREAAEATARFVSGPYRFEVLEGVDHWVMERAPEDVSRLIVDRIRPTVETTEESQQRARRALGRAYRALGGEALDGFTALTSSIEGYSTNRGQSRRPAPPYDPTPITGLLAYEKDGRLYTELSFSNVGGTDRSYRRLIDGDEGWNLWTPRRLLTEISPREVQRLLGGSSTNVALVFPHSLVLDALKRPLSLRWLGETEAAGERANLISYAASNGQTVSLAIGTDGLVRTAEWMIYDTRLGPVPRRTEFSDYRPTDGIQVAYTVGFTIGNEETGQWSLDEVELVSSIPANLVARPDIDPPEHPPAFQPHELAPGTFAVRLFTGPGNSYNSLLVELDEGVVVVEPILADAFAGPVSGLARQVTGGKEVRWVVATHHHSDHIGGALGYLRTGATLLTTAHGAQIVREMDTASGGRQTGDGPDVSVVRDKTVLGRGSRRVEILAVPGTDHAEQMLIVYVPHARTVYVADIFAIPETGIMPPSKLTGQFADALASLGLVVETIVPAHGLVGSMADLERALGR